MARPSKYDPVLCQKAVQLASGGATDEEIADALKISTRTLYRWQAQFPEFCQSLKAGKEPADERIVRSLYHRAAGFEWTEQQAFKLKEVSFEGGNRIERERVEIVDVRKQMPPDTTAAIFWLKNRQPERWRDKQDFEHTGKDGAPLVPVLNVTIGGTGPASSSKAG